jgi:anion-transporting  ArsA/GET3 family ATPase
MTFERKGRFPETPLLQSFYLDFFESFEEFIEIKLKLPKLAHLFAQQKLIRKLAEAAPGMHDLVFLGKIWFESRKYDHVVVDLPASGHGLTLLLSAHHWNRLLAGGPLQRDVHEVLTTLENPEVTKFLWIATPEEMPLEEAREFIAKLKVHFPKQDPLLLINKMLPFDASYCVESGSPIRQYASARVERERLLTLQVPSLKVPLLPWTFLPAGATQGGRQDESSLLRKMMEELRTL